MSLFADIHLMAIGIGYDGTTTPGRIPGGRNDLAAGKEETLDELWTMRNGEEIYIKEPKLDMLRVTLNQITHHRAQLGVFLRLLDVPIPGSYGPSADDMSF